MEAWFGIANGQISSNFDIGICPRDAHIFVSDDNLSKCQGILTKLGTCIDSKEILSWIVCQFLTELSASDTIMAGYYGFAFLFKVNVFLTHCSRETRKRVIGKQCRPRSDAAECGRVSTVCK